MQNLNTEYSNIGFYSFLNAQRTFGFEPLFESNGALVASEPARLLIRKLPELGLLAGDDVDKSPEGLAQMDPLQEVARTMAGLGIFNLLRVGDERAYEVFSFRQKESLRISKKTFSALVSLQEQATKQLHTYCLANGFTPTEEQLTEAQAVLDVLADIGKNKKLLKQFNIPEDEHDIALARLINIHSEDEDFLKHVPTFARLPEALQKAVVDILGKDFNLGHILQGETCARGLMGIVALDPNLRLVAMLHHTRDIAGARGHIDFSGTAILIDKKVADICKLVQFIEEAELNPAANPEFKCSGIYKKFTQSKHVAYSLGEHLGFSNLSEAEKDALTHALLTARVDEFPERFIPLMDAWKSLNNHDRSVITINTQKSGFRGSSMFIITYRPGLIDNIARTLPHDLNKAMSLGLIILSDLIAKSEVQSLSDSSSGGGVKRVNCRAYASDLPGWLSRRADATAEELIMEIKNRTSVTLEPGGGITAHFNLSE